MEFIGNFGVDLKLLVAQLINFGILLLLLKKFLYQPIIKRIEQDEAELSRTQTERKKLEAEKTAFAQQKKIQMEEARQRANQIISEAEEIAEEIKEKAKKEAQVEMKTWWQLNKKKLLLKKSAIREEIYRHVQQRVKENLRKGMAEILPDQTRRVLSDVFYQQLLQQLEELNLDTEKKLKQVLVKWRASGGISEELISAKLGPVVLWYADQISREQRHQLAKIIEKRLGVKLPISKKKDKSLISGYRLEIGGVLLESNLRQIVSDGLS